MFYVLLFITWNLGKLHVRRIALTELKEDCKLAFDKVVAESWSLSVADVFLHSCGVNQKSRDHVLNNAERLLIWNNREDLKASSHEQYVFHITEFALHPEKYQFPTVCAMWEAPFTMDMFIDEPMHLLPEGAVKGTNELVVFWCARQKVTNEVMRTFAPHLSDIVELQLERFKILELNGNKFTGYVAENWLAFLRIMPWAYQLIDKVSPDVPFMWNHVEYSKFT